MVFSSSKRLCRRLLPLLLFACLLCLVCTLHTYAEAPSLTLQGDAAVTYGDDLALRITLSDAAFTPGDAVTLTLAGVDEPICHRNAGSPGQCRRGQAHLPLG